MSAVLYERLQPLYGRLAELSTLPLWEIYDKLVVSSPEPLGTAHLWRYAELRELLMEAGEAISASEAERRVLALKNPALERPGIAQTLFAGLQLVMPGEVAPAHRHSQGALRFVLESDGGYTAVEGERCRMHRGDFVTTPSWTWHDHENTGDGPLIWLDGLDVPLVSFFGARFAEESPTAQQPIHRPDDDSVGRWGSGMRPYGAIHERAYSPVFSYPYERARAAVEAMSVAADPDPHHGWKMIYANPLDGGHVLPTIAAFLQKLPAAFRTRPWRSTEATVFVAVEGGGTARVAGEPFDFAVNDVFVVPNWSVLELEAGTQTVLFSFSDRAAQERLGLWREEPDPVLP